MLLFFPRGVLDEILNLIESVSEGFPSYFNKPFKEIFISGITGTELCCVSVVEPGGKQPLSTSILV